MGACPEVSIILVSWNRCEDLRIALDSLDCQTGVSKEVIVIDNGSSDGTLEMLSSRPTPPRVIRNKENRGACIGKNQGILAAQGDCIAFMDSDACLLNPSTLRDFRASLAADASLGAIGPGIFIDRDLNHPWVSGIHLTEDLYIDWTQTRSTYGECDALSTCFAMMPREAALKSGGFDPVYFYQHEDLDFFIRIREMGFRIESREGYPVWHRISQAGRKNDRMFWMHFREEWRHQYLLIKIKGVWMGLYYYIRNLFRQKSIRDYYVRHLRLRKFIVLFGMLPVFMLLLSPWISLQRGKNHLLPRKERD